MLERVVGDRARRAGDVGFEHGLEDAAALVVGEEGVAALDGVGALRKPGLAELLEAGRGVKPRPRRVAKISGWKRVLPTVTTATALATRAALGR